MPKKGETNNKNGRPPTGQAMTEILREKIDKEKIADKLIKMANKGNFPALKYIYDRVDGMPKQSIDLTGEVDMNVNINIEGTGGPKPQDS